MFTFAVLLVIQNNSCISEYAFVIILHVSYYNFKVEWNNGTLSRWRSRGKINIDLLLILCGCLVLFGCCECSKKSSATQDWKLQHNVIIQNGFRGGKPWDKRARHHDMQSPPTSYIEYLSANVGVKYVLHIFYIWRNFLKFHMESWPFLKVRQTEITFQK